MCSVLLKHCNCVESTSWFVQCLLSVFSTSDTCWGEQSLQHGTTGSTGLWRELLNKLYFQFGSVLVTEKEICFVQTVIVVHLIPEIASVWKRTGTSVFGMSPELTEPLHADTAHVTCHCRLLCESNINIMTAGLPSWFARRADACTLTLTSCLRPEHCSAVQAGPVEFTAN